MTSSDPDRNLVLVHGPPGTGKTRYLAEQCAAAAAEHGREAVCIVSLTRTAAAEIAERVDLPDANVGTLHSHCYRALEFPALAETAAGINAWNSEHPALRMGQAQRQEDAPAADLEQGTDTDRIHARVQGLRQRRIPAERWSTEEQAHHRAWSTWKAEVNRLDFTDLVERALADGRHPLRPKVILVDEAQDLSVLELRLIERWAAAARTTIVAGDTRQALYTWRGSDPDALLDLHYTSEQVLAQSWRVPSAVHAAAVSWVSQMHERRPVAYHPTASAGYVHQSASSLRNPEVIARLITSTLDRSPDDKVMLLTACGYMLTPVLKELKAQAIPFHNPRRPDHNGWNPLKAANRLKAFLRPDVNIWPDGESRSWTWADMAAWTDMVKSAGNLPRGLKTTIEAEIVGDPPDRFGEKASAADNEIPPEQVAELLGTPVTFRHRALHLDTDWLRSALLPKYQTQLAYAYDVMDRHGRKALVREPRLMVGTIHSMKGAEADHVILAPDLSRAGQVGWDTGGPDRDSIIRAFYVAITRARKTLTILEPSGPDHVDHHRLRSPEPVSS